MDDKMKRLGRSILFAGCAVLAVNSTAIAQDQGSVFGKKEPTTGGSWTDPDAPTTGGTQSGNVITLRPGSSNNDEPQATGIGGNGEDAAKRAAISELQSDLAGANSRIRALEIQLNDLIATVEAQAEQIDALEAGAVQSVADDAVVTGGGDEVASAAAVVEAPTVREEIRSGLVTKIYSRANLDVLMAEKVLAPTAMHGQEYWPITQNTAGGYYKMSGFLVIEETGTHVLSIGTRGTPYSCSFGIKIEDQIIFDWRKMPGSSRPFRSLDLAAGRYRIDIDLQTGERNSNFDICALDFYIKEPAAQGFTKLAADRFVHIVEVTDDPKPAAQPELKPSRSLDSGSTTSGAVSAAPKQTAATTLSRDVVPSTPRIEPVSATSRGWVARYDVALRATPSAKGRKVGDIQKGAQIPVRGLVSNALFRGKKWFQVDLFGDTAYVWSGAVEGY